MNCIFSVFRHIGCIWCWDPLRPSDGYNLDSFLFKRLPVFWVIGPQKCGKAELAELLAKAYQYQLLKIDELLEKPHQKDKWRARIIESYLERRANVIQEIVVDVLKEAIVATNHKATGYIIEGFPLCVQDAKLFEREICKVSKVIYVTIGLNDFLTKLPKDTTPEEVDAARKKYIQDTKNLDAIYEEYEDKAIKRLFTDSPNDICNSIVKDLEFFYGHKPIR